MKFSKQHSKRPLPILSVLSARLNGYQDKLCLRWQKLLPRDQMALGLLLVFLVFFTGGYGGYSVHQAAKDSKNHYQEQVADYFWLRAQASNINSSASDTANDAAQPATTSISSLLAASGIEDGQVVAAGGGVQLSFSHPSQAIVSTILGQLDQQGWQFTQLTMQQDIVTKQIQVQATIVS